MVDDVRAGARAYQEIKQAILSGGLRQRERLDIEVLASRFQVSATPVRQALAILTTERLVSAGGARGYRVAFWTERDLGELYLWRAQLARLALGTAAPANAPMLARDMPYEDAFTALMEALDANANEELKRAGRAANERLRSALRIEPEVLANATADLQALAQALTVNNKRRTLGRVRRHFERRIAHVGAIRAAAHAKATPNNGD